MTNIRTTALLMFWGLALAGCPAPDAMYSLPKAPDGSPGAISGFGYEPSWNLRIDKNSWAITSANPDLNRSGSTPPGTPLPEGGWRYQSDGVTIDVLSGYCRDAETGQRYYDTIEIAVDGDELKGCGGIELPPENLDSTSWTGQKQIPEPGGYIPRQFDGEIAFADGKVSGSTGCNRFNGSYRVEDGVLFTGPLVMTKKLCEGLPGRFEQRFVTLLEQPVQVQFLRSGAMVISRRTEDADPLFLTFDRAD